MALSKGSMIRLRGSKNKVVGALDFQFNPGQLTRTGTAEWQWGQGPGSVLPVATFGKMGEQAINLELLFDARETFSPALEGLRAVLAEAEAMGLPAVDKWEIQRKALAVPPDRVVLVLGKRRWYCHITNWNIVEEMWNNKLDPVRARVSYSLRLINTGVREIRTYMKQLDSFRKKYEGRVTAGEPTASTDPQRGGSGGNPFDAGL